ncbi:S8 family serine peptidase [Clostridium cylindrosporum]|uniref:Subtilase family n=1 Tax=Clostridium cylindrosporum DSM 605 TaxID=1121307 RepID=A0A0J8DFD3_CLOCY|nr:S8 family serine peptidase [Clostridium cylindrosporum]KMT22893.1 subtilase family [Clostridium cylindrosporum DSM 605]
MIKKASTIILALALTGFINLNSSMVVQAKPTENNPFATLDKARAERVSTAKGETKDGDILKGGISLKQRKLQEKKSLSTPGKRYVVKFSNNASLEKVFEIVSNYEYKLIGKSDQRVFMVKLEDLQGFKEKASGFIEFIEEDKKSKLQAIPSDPGYKYQWGLPAINMPKAWDISKGSESVFVAVIDSGIYREHPDFDGVDIRNGASVVSDGPCYDDTQGHGTSVTGIIGAQTNNGVGIAGVNWDVAIVPFGVAYYTGEIYDSDIAIAINLAADIGCKVINLSLGADSYSRMEDMAVQYALSKGSIVIAAAGNEGNSVYNYPASYNGVISVGSVKSNLSKSSFSTFNNKVDVVAPGEGILTTADWQYSDDGADYEYVDGTSFASPHVAGVAAIAASLDPSLTPAKFEKLIQSTSKDLGPTGYDNYYGYGLINTEKILNSLVHAAESDALKNAKAKVSHLTKSLKTNYLGIKNQAAWQSYIAQARELIKKIPSYERAQKEALTIEVDKDEALVNGLARINHVEKSIQPKSEGGYGNYLGIKNAEAWNEYLRLAKIDLDKVDKSIFKKQYDELIARMNKVALVVTDIEDKFKVEYDRVVNLYNEAKATRDLNKALDALKAAEELGTCDRSDQLEIDIKKLINDIQGNVEVEGDLEV